MPISDLKPATFAVIPRGRKGDPGAAGAPGDQLSFDSVAAAAAVTIDPAVNHIRTAGFATFGDGGDGLYVRRVSEPAHPGKFQDDGGAWFELIENEPNLCQFGGSPAALDNWQALADMAAYSVAKDGLHMTIPAGDWTVDTTGRAEISILGTLEGTSPTTNLGAGALGGVRSGSFILVKGTGASVFRLRSRSSLRNVGFLYPDQITPLTPIAYPPTIHIFQDALVVIDDVLIMNAYIGIDIGTSSGLITIKNCHFGTSKQSIRFASILSECWIVNNSFSFGIPYDFYAALGLLEDWTTYYRANCSAIAYEGATFTGADAHVISGNVFVGPAFAIQCVSGSPSGAGLWATVTGNHFDGAHQAIAFNGTARPVNFTVTGNTFQYFGETEAAYLIVIAPSEPFAGPYDIQITGNRFSVAAAGHMFLAATPGQEAVIGISNNSFFRPGHLAPAGPYDCVFASGDTIDITFTGNTFDGAESGGDNGCINMGGARTLTVTGNTFKNGNKGIAFNGTVQKATIVGNTSVNIADDVAGAATVKHQEGLNSWNA